MRREDSKEKAEGKGEEMIKAKGKLRQERIEEDEKALKEFEKVTPVIKREKREKQTVSSHEIVNVLTNTFDRLAQEFDPKMPVRDREVLANDRAIMMLRVIKHGIPETPGHGVRIMEEEQEAPLCRNCR